MRVPARIAVYGGSFASQPMVFAHLWEAAPALDPGEVEVICQTDPVARLAHHFDTDTAGQIDAALGMADTCVLIFAEAGAPPPSDDKLSLIGCFSGHRHRPD